MTTYDRPLMVSRSLCLCIALFVTSVILSGCATEMYEPTPVTAPNTRYQSQRLADEWRNAYPYPMDNDSEYYTDPYMGGYVPNARGRQIRPRYAPQNTQPNYPSYNPDEDNSYVPPAQALPRGTIPGTPGGQGQGNYGDMPLPQDNEQEYYPPMPSRGYVPPYTHGGKTDIPQDNDADYYPLFLDR